jgi:hypothetical protein
MVMINMEKPAGCNECRLKDYDHIECKPARKKLPWTAAMDECAPPEWCPLIEIEVYAKTKHRTLYKEK